MQLKVTYVWCVPVIFLVIMLMTFWLNNKRVDRLFLYHNIFTNSVALERHRSTWSLNLGDSICTFVNEQMLLPVYADLTPIFDVTSPTLCIYHQGTLYLNFNQDFAANSTSLYSAEQQIKLFTRAIRLNFRAVQEVYIAIDGQPRAALDSARSSTGLNIGN